MKPEILENPEKIKQFLSTQEGKKYFQELTKDFSRANRSDFKKKLINPKPTTRRRLGIRDKLILEISKEIA